MPTAGRTGVAHAGINPEERGWSHFFKRRMSPVPFLTKIAQIYRRSLASPYVPAFSTQVNRLLSSLKLEEIVLCSLFEGDLSHIGEISHQAAGPEDPASIETVGSAGRRKNLFDQKNAS